MTDSYSGTLRVFPTETRFVKKQHMGIFEIGFLHLKTNDKIITVEHH